MVVHGVLLTGGRSSRMGVHKATIEFDGRTLAARAAQALRDVADPVLAIGPAFDTGLDDVRDPGEGPLVAFVSGADELKRRGCDGPVFLVACDMPFVDADVLRLLGSMLEGKDGVVPVVGGRDQPSISLFTPDAIDVARAVVAEGARSMKAWLARIDVRRFDDDTGIFEDVDTPEDLARARALLLERRARIVR